VPGQMCFTRNAPRLLRRENRAAESTASSMPRVRCDPRAFLFSGWGVLPSVRVRKKTSKSLNDCGACSSIYGPSRS
jgi:hypothetical protein